MGLDQVSEMEDKAVTNRDRIFPLRAGAEGVATMIRPHEPLGESPIVGTVLKVKWDEDSIGAFPVCVIVEMDSSEVLEIPIADMKLRHEFDAQRPRRGELLLSWNDGSPHIRAYRANGARRVVGYLGARLRARRAR